MEALCSCSNWCHQFFSIINVSSFHHQRILYNKNDRLFGQRVTLCSKHQYPYNNLSEIYSKWRSYATSDILNIKKTARFTCIHVLSLVSSEGVTRINIQYTFTKIVLKKMLLGTLLKYHITYWYFVLFVNKKRLIKRCLVIDTPPKY